MQSYGEIVLYSNTAPQTFTGSARIVKNWGANGENSSANEGDLAVRPDYANNRIKVKAGGTYRVTFRASGQATNDAATYAFYLYRNGVRYSQLQAAARTVIGDAGDIQLVIDGVIKTTLAEADASQDVALDIRGLCSAEQSSSSSSNSSSSSSSSTTNSSSSSSSKSSQSSNSSSSSSSTNSSSSSSSTNSSSSSSTTVSSLSSQSSSSSSSNSSSSSSSSSSNSSSSSSSVNIGGVRITFDAASLHVESKDR